MRKWCFCFVLLSSGFYKLLAQELNAWDMLDTSARRFIEARQYQSAAQLYQSAIERADLDEELRKRLLYDLGTVQLLQGNWRQALQFYDQIDLTRNDAPDLWRRYSYNTALALLWRAQAPKNAAQPYAQASTDLKLAEEWLSVVKDMDCLNMSFVDQKCVVPADVKNVLVAVRDNQFALERQQEEVRQIQETVLSASVKGLYLSRRLIQQLQAALRASSIPTSYLALIKVQVEEYNDSLTLLQELLTVGWRGGESKQARERLKAKVRTALQKQSEALDAIENAKIQDAILLIQEVEDLLLEIVNSQLPRGDELAGADSLRSLLAEYLLVDAAPVLESTALQRLSAQQQKMLGAARQVVFDEDESYLTLAEAAFADGLPLLAHAFIQAGQAQIWHSLFIYTSSDGVPHTVLLSAFGMQKMAMRMASTVMQLPAEVRQQSSSHVVSLHQALRKQQEWVIEAAKRFSPNVHRVEMAQFEGKRACVRDPWLEVMPLFFDGLSAAEAAQKELSESNASLSFVYEEQKVAYRKWLKALELLAKEAAGGSEMRDKSLKVETAVDSPTSVEEVLRLLQQMDRQDRPYRSPEPKLPEGVRPW